MTVKIWTSINWLSIQVSGMLMYRVSCTKYL